MLSFHHSGFILLLSLITLNLFSQDKILLISGKTIEGKILNIGEDTIRFQFRNKEKTEESFVESYRVFSINYDNGKEKIIYKYDSTTVNDRSIEELRNFIAGEQDALKGYKPAFAGLLPFLISGAITFVMKGSFAIIVVPFLTYMAFVVLFRAGIDKHSVRDPKLLSNPDYIEGYKRIAKSKINRNALWGSIIGTGVGFGIYMISKSESDF